MPRVSQETQPIVVDTDLLSSFYHVHVEGLLRQTLSGPLIVPTQVETEFSYLRGTSLNFIYQAVSNDIAARKLDKLLFPAIGEEADEYYRLISLPKRPLGKGEAAALSWVRFHGGTVLSNNLGDVRKYSEQCSINFMCTEEILCIAVEKGLATEQRACGIWNGMKKVGIVLPSNDFPQSLESFRKGLLV